MSRLPLPAAECPEESCDDLHYNISTEFRAYRQELTEDQDLQFKTELDFEMLSGYDFGFKANKHRFR